MNKKYTFKEILLALREEILKNESLINQLNNLIKVDNENVTYSFSELLKKDDTPYHIILTIDELEQKQSLLKSLLNKLLINTSYYRVSIPRFCRYDVVEENKNYKLNLSHNELEKNDLGKVTIIDKEKFAEIVNQLKNSKLSTIEHKGIHISNQLYLEIAHFALVQKEKDSICYWPGNDGLHLTFNGGDFQDVLNTEIDASILSDELKALIDNSDFKSVDVELINERKNKYNGIYDITEKNRKLILTRKK